ncbi:MAG: hypothetical protein ACFCD0_13525 [Gemmataceae bacterium]
MYLPKTLPRRFCVAVLLFAVVGFFVGCGAKRTGYDVETEAGKLEQFVQEISDRAGSDRSWSGVVAKSNKAALNDRKKFREYSGFFVEGEPTIEGDTATANVRIMKMVIKQVKFEGKLHRDYGEAEVATLEWSFVKEDGKWKIQKAKLP